MAYFLPAIKVRPYNFMSIDMLLHLVQDCPILLRERLNQFFIAFSLSMQNLLALFRLGLLALNILGLALQVQLSFF